MNVLSCACAVLAITCCAASCATPPPASDAVRVTTALPEVADCKLLGKVIVSDTAPDAAKEARAQTAGLGGNVLLRKNELVWNGNAYLCPTGAH
jgi:hypothetical protein